MDNASYHRSKEVFNFISELQVKPIFDLPYHPDWNCAIEIKFSILKQNYRKHRLKALAQGKTVRPNQHRKSGHQESQRRKPLQLDWQVSQNLALCLRIREEGKKNLIKIKRMIALGN